MGVVIYLRQQETINRFRDLMIAAITSKLGDNIILCSGFFQEDDVSGPRKSPYTASTEKDFAKILSSHNIKVTTIGVHNSGWTSKYDRFVDALIKEKVTVNAKKVSGLKWHAKVFIYLKGDEPILGIVGSSNITRPAFSDTSPFNYEADVVLWEDNCAIDSTVKHTLPDLPNDETKAEMWQDVIIAGYSSNSNGNLTITDRLKALVNQLSKVKTTEKQLDENEPT